MRIGITGTAGFIGMHLAAALLRKGHDVISVDSMNPAYQTNMAELRSNHLRDEYGHTILKLDISRSVDELFSVFDECEVIYHLAAWPGVRLSSQYPDQYFQNNVVAHSNMISVVARLCTPKFFYASSSSVYGDLGSFGPVSDQTLIQNESKSYYAATKVINEINANSYPFNSKVQPVALRFFTVFGPWGRPDMAYWSFAEKILTGEAISLYGPTGGSRNFTYVDDAVSILTKLLGAEIPSSVRALNIANSEPLNTIDMVSALGRALNVKNVNFEIASRPKEDAEATWANTNTLMELIGATETTNFEHGINEFANWYLGHRSEIKQTT